MADRLGTACAEQEANLVMLHYEELDANTRAVVDAHVRNCPGCAGYLKSLTALLPLTIKIDEPPEEFWRDYDRELRRKIADAAEQKSWLQRLAAISQPRWLPAAATAALVAIALTFSLQRGSSSKPENAPDEAAIMEVLPITENLDFFKTMEVLDNLELLESMASTGSAA